MKNDSSHQEVTLALARLEQLLDTVPALLHAIPPDEFEQKPAPGKWSKKEILGHLIDSAANNHHRFVRGQFENMPLTPYAQNEWVANSYYQQMDQAHLIDVWHTYNRHLLQLTRLMPQEKHQRALHAENNASYTLAFLIVDYVDHLEHHIKQLSS